MQILVVGDPSRLVSGRICSIGRHLGFDINADAHYVPLARFIETLSQYIGTDNFEVSYWPATGKAQ